MEAAHGGRKCNGRTEHSEGCPFCSYDAEKPRDDACISECPGKILDAKPLIALRFTNKERISTFHTVDCRMSPWSQYQGSCLNCYRESHRDLVSKYFKRRTRIVEEDARYGGEACRLPNGTEVRVGLALVQVCSPSHRQVPLPTP